MNRILFIMFIALFCTACDSLRRRNIAHYERSLEIEEKKRFPPEPILARKRVDDGYRESPFDHERLNEKERAVMNKYKEKDKREARARSKKIFGAFAPKK